jgi:hypothetical protein
MSDQTERRQDHDTRLIVRVAVLESRAEEALRVRLYHETELARLTQQDSDLLTALNNINGKFDALLKQIATGFNVLCYVGGAMVIAVSAFWTYSLSLDSRFEPKLEQVSQEVLASKDHIAQGKERIENIDTELDKIKKKKVVRASK